MPWRATLFTLLLCFSLVACNKPPAENTGSEPNASQPAAPSTTQSGTSQPMAKREAAKPAPAPVTVPAGTVLTVRMGEAVGSKISQPGQTFSATLADPVQVDGKTVIPAGAAAAGTVVAAKPLGRFKGGALLQLKLTSINIEGTDHSIETSSVVRTQKGKGKRTAVITGGGAGLGAIIGGIAGGGKGAAIGALAGAGAGGAGSAFTGNKEIVIPAESALSFRLEQPVPLK
jgi:hypothetical protein